MKVYEKVSSFIKLHHLKQISIAKEMDIPNQIFNAMLNGKRKMYADDLRKICIALGVSADYFLDLANDTKEKSKDSA